MTGRWMVEKSGKRKGGRWKCCAGKCLTVSCLGMKTLSCGPCPFPGYKYFQHGWFQAINGMSLNSVLGRDARNEVVWAGPNQPWLTTCGTEGKKEGERKGSSKINNNDNNSNNDKTSGLQRASSVPGSASGLSQWSFYTSLSRTGSHGLS